ncbi:MAG: amidase [Thermomicrobiales bacterium]
MSFRSNRVSRRDVLKAGAVAAAGAAALSVGGVARGSTPYGGHFSPHADALEETSIAELQARMESGELTSRQLVGMYLERIHALDKNGPMLNSVIELNPDALQIATEMDRERADGNVRGPLHGIPIAIKDNIDTGDKMNTRAGSLALVDSRPLQDATVAAKLREAGAIIIAKLGLSEWANFRGNNSSSGWSAVGGQVRNPYIIDRNPCGSSSGSGTAASASLVAATLGTETDGSIVCPSNNCGLVGIKPTVGLTSRAGVIPISHTQDTIGPMARTVADAAAVLTAIAGADDRDPATDDAQNVSDDYTQFLNPEGLGGARIGVARELFGFSQEADRVMADAIQAMADAGATIVDPITLPNLEEINESGAEFQVLLYEFGPDLEAYLAGRTANSPKTLADIVAFNNAHSGVELKWFGQELMEISASLPGLDDPDYLEFLEISRDGSRAQINEALEENDLDAIIAPTGSPAWPIDLINGDHFLGGSSSPAARAGYPLVTVPAGYVYGLPVGVTFMGRAWDEGTLITLASGFEAVTQVRQAPHFLSTHNW